MARAVLVLAALLCRAAAEFESQTCTQNRQATIQAGAEAMLGGVVILQTEGADGYGCGAFEGGMQWYEALRYSLDLINKKDEVLNGELLTDYYVPGVRLGMQVINNCGHPDQGVAAVSSFFPTLSADDRSCSQQTSNMTLGIVGAVSSGTAGRVSGFANMFNIPVVSPHATAQDLTYSGRYPNFMRTIPLDNGLMTVMGRVLTRLQWTFVVVVYEDSLYGREAYNALRPVLAEANICLTAAFMADRDDTSASTMQNLLGQVVASDAIGTIYLGSSPIIKALLEQGSSVNGARKLQWLITDSLPLDTTFSYSYPNGLLALVPASRYIVEFEDHWVRIDEESPSPENPWFRDWYMEKHQCNLAGVSKYSKQCSAMYQGLTPEEIERKKRLSFVQDQFVEPAVHSVFTYAYALREAQQALCPQRTGICPQLASLSHEEFLNNYLKKVDFIYAARERVPSLASDQYAPYKAAKRLRFDSRGDIVNPSFSLWNYNDLPTGEEDSQTFKFREVGNYINGRLSLNTDNIRMYAEDRTTPLQPLPTSPCPARGCSPCLGMAREMKYYFQDGDIVINGIFSLHRPGPSKFTCGDLISSTHPLYLEAMIYAVKRVNADASILPGVALGGLGIDDCMDSDLSTNFIVQVQNGQYTVKDRSGGALDPRKVKAYTGAYNTSLTVPLAGLMDTFMQPMVGYRAASARLYRYQYYLKTVPSMEDEFRAIIMIMKSLGWAYTQLLFSTDAYGRDDVRRFQHLAAEAGICVVADYMFDAQNRKAVEMLSTHSTVKPVVLLLSRLNHRQLLDVLNETGSAGQYRFIATSTLGSDAYITQGYETQAEGFISIDINYSNLTRFYNDLNALRVSSYQDNPWFEEWFESVFKCYVGGNPRGFTSPCDPSVGIASAPGFMKDLKVVHVINAVYAIARGLHSVLTKYCGSGYNGVCPQFLAAGRSREGMDLVQEILKVSFPIEDSNPSQTFRFFNRGGAYTYMVYRYFGGRFTDVGRVTPSTYSMSDLTTGVVAMPPPSCPAPCAECLYMFAFQKYWYLDGDLIIPAVFDVHYKGSSSMYSCGPLRVSNGVQYTEAFKFALDFVNAGASGVQLRNVTLGGLAFDGCSSAARAWAIINGVMGRNFPVLDDDGDAVDIGKLVSWLTYDSESTMGAGDMLKMMGMPLVSPGATAPQLLDKTKYSTFFRTIPSDTVIARAMANFVHQMGWKYVITLNAPDAGNRKTRDLFRQYLKDMGICVIATLEFETDGSADVILSSIQGSTTQVVAVFADPDQYVSEMLQRKEALNPRNDIVFIANHYWDLERYGLKLRYPQGSSVAENSLSFRMTDPTVSDFISYLNGLTLAGSDNPWLIEYYQALFECDLNGNAMYGKSCATTTLNLGNSGNIFQHTYVLSTINAVHALAVGLSQVLVEKCGAQYSGVCSRFLTDSDTMERLMTAMDGLTFTDAASIMFDFVQREANRGFEVQQHDRQNKDVTVAEVAADANMTYTAMWNPSTYAGVKSECYDECLVCEGIETNFKNFTFIQGDVYIVGLFDVHTEGSTPYTCGGLNEYQGLQLLEAFNYAIEYINQKREIFDEKLRSVQVGGIGIDVCRSPSRAANLVANIHSGNIRLTLSGGLEINRRQILAYVGPFNTESTIRVADILSAIGVPQVTYGATGLELQNAVKYPYLLRSVPADDKQARAIVSYLKNFNMTNIQVVTSRESVGSSMTKEFMRLAALNLVCIKRNFTLGEVFDEPISRQSEKIVQEIVRTEQAMVVVLLVKDPLPILQAAGNNDLAREKVLWIATDKWGYDTAFLDKLRPLLGDRRSNKNVIIFDVETADVPAFDTYLHDKTPANYTRNPWFTDFYERQFQCTATGPAQTCDRLRGLSRRPDYIQDPYVLYVVNAVLSAGLGIDGALQIICSVDGVFSGICPRFEVTGNRRDIVLAEMKKVNFTDNTLQPYYFEPTGESSRGYHIYNVTANYDQILKGDYMFENVGSFNDSHFLKLDITYNVTYPAYCVPYENCECVNPFPEIIPSRYMLKPSPFELNLVYIGDIHQRDPADPFACSSISVGADFFKMMAFFYAIERVNGNLDNQYPESLRLGGIALDTCSSTLRLEQDIFNLLSGYPLCDTGESGQVVPPSSVVAFLPDGSANSEAVSSILVPTGITAVSPSAVSTQLREFTMSEHFLSIIPPDDALAKVMLQMMGEMSWNYASVIYTVEPGMEEALKELLRQTALHQTACIGQAVPLRLDADINDAEAALEVVGQQVGARAVILLTLPAHNRLLLQAAKNRGQTGRFVWVAPRSWGRNSDSIRGLEEQASGAIILQPYARVVEDFRAYVKSLNFTNRRGIPDDWFEEIYQTIHRCKIVTARRSLPFSSLCSKVERITDAMVPFEPSVLHTIIAVYMVAQGLNSIPGCQDTNYDISACITRLQNRNDAIYQAILTSQWNVLPALLGDNSFSFSFTPDKYGNIGFDILNYHGLSSGSAYAYTQLGRYTDSLTMDPKLYRGFSAYDQGVIPVSSCGGSQCRCQGPDGLFGVPSQWTFRPGLANIEKVEEGKTYEDPVTRELVYVEKIPDITSRFKDIWGVAIATLAAIGVFVSLCLFIYLLVVYPVRGGTSVLGYVLAFGIILLYGLVFAFVAHASVELCGLRRFCLGFCYAICYSALFVKLVDCWRSREKEDMFEVKYNKLGRPLGLFMVTVMLVVVQVIINAEWLILEEPQVVRIFYNSQYWPRCTPNDFYDEGLVLSLCYIMVLILLTVLLGFCTFNNTKNHRESRWILGIAILAVPTWVIWCAWATLGAIKTRDAAVAVGLLVNATVLLLLGPVRKLYLLNKYQALMEEEDRDRAQQERAAGKANDYSNVYDNQYDNAPQLHDRASAAGSARGSYRYPPSSVGHSGQ